MVSTLDFESSDPSSNLGGTSSFWEFLVHLIYIIYNNVGYTREPVKFVFNLI